MQFEVFKDQQEMLNHCGIRFKTRNEYIKFLNELTKETINHPKVGTMLWTQIFLGLSCHHVDIETYDRVGVVGSRGFKDYKLLKQTLDEYKIGAIVSGKAKGADSLSERYAKERLIPTLIFKPEWNKNGRYNPRAGFERNVDIVMNSDLLIAFWDGESLGTKDSIEKAKTRGLEVVVVEYK